MKVDRQSISGFIITEQERIALDTTLRMVEHLVENMLDDDSIAFEYSVFHINDVKLCKKILKAIYFKSKNETKEKK